MKISLKFKRQGEERKSKGRTIRVLLRIAILSSRLFPREYLFARLDADVHGEFLFPSLRRERE